MVPPAPARDCTLCWRPWHTQLTVLFVYTATPPRANSLGCFPHCHNTPPSSWFLYTPRAQHSTLCCLIYLCTATLRSPACFRIYFQSPELAHHTLCCLFYPHRLLSSPSAVFLSHTVCCLQPLLSYPHRLLSFLPSHDNLSRLFIFLQPHPLVYFSTTSPACFLFYSGPGARAPCLLLGVCAAALRARPEPVAQGRAQEQPAGRPQEVRAGEARRRLWHPARQLVSNYLDLRGVGAPAVSARGRWLTWSRVTWSLGRDPGSFYAAE